MNFACPVARNRNTDRGNFLAVEIVVSALQFAGQQPGVVVDGVHFKHPIARGDGHFFVVGEDHRLEHVGELGDAGHFHAVAMPVEDVEGNAGDERVTQRALLVKKSRVCARLDVIPRAPFIHDQADFFLRVVSVHDG